MMNTFPVQLTLTRYPTKFWQKYSRQASQYPKTSTAPSHFNVQSLVLIVVGGWSQFSHPAYGTQSYFTLTQRVRDLILITSICGLKDLCLVYWTSRSWCNLSRCPSPTWHWL